MDLKRFAFLQKRKDELQDTIRGIDNVLLLDTDAINIFAANNITIADLSNLLNIKSFPDCNRLYGYWDDGGETASDTNSLNYILKILNMSKNDLAYIISKSRVFKKMLNIDSYCYFVNLLIKLENTKYASSKDKIISSKETIEIDDQDSKLDEAIRLLNQVLSMVVTDLEIKFKDFDLFFVNGQEKIKECFSSLSSESINIDSSRAIVFNNSGALIIYSNNKYQEILAGGSDVAIKLYEDLLVGYKKNKSTAVYYSGMFSKYIIS